MDSVKLKRRKEIQYKCGFKYQLVKRFQIEIPITPDEYIWDEFITLSKEGLLTIHAGYAWDGPSGPVIDRKETMRASLVHDALYQLMRLQWLDEEEWRKLADELFEIMCEEDGVPAFCARAYYLGLRVWGNSAALPANKKATFRAP